MNTRNVLIIAAIAATAVGGCVSPEEMARREQARQQTIQEFGERYHLHRGMTIEEVYNATQDQKFYWMWHTYGVSLPTREGLTAGIDTERCMYKFDKNGLLSWDPH